MLLLRERSFDWEETYRGLLGSCQDFLCFSGCYLQGCGLPYNNSLSWYTFVIWSEDMFNNTKVKLLCEFEKFKKFYLNF